MRNYIGSVHSADLGKIETFVTAIKRGICFFGHRINLTDTRSITLLGAWVSISGVSLVRNCILTNSHTRIDEPRLPSEHGNDPSRSSSCRKARIQSDKIDRGRNGVHRVGRGYQNMSS